MDWDRLKRDFPEEWEEAHETHTFSQSGYGAKRRKQLEEIIETTKNDVLITINSGAEGSIEDARAGAALVEGLRLAIGVLYENDLLTAEGLLAAADVM